MQPDVKSSLIGREIRTHTCAMRRKDLNNRLGRSGRASNEQCIAPKSPIGPILMVAQLRRLGECQRSGRYLPALISTKASANALPMGAMILAAPR